MWQAYIDDALVDPRLSDFEREVLSDYQITDAEYQEARDRFRDCMADLGWVVTDGPDHSYQVEGAVGTVNERQADSDYVGVSCQVGTTSYIEPIYLGMRDNPEGIAWSEEVRSCYQANSVPDGAGFSDDQFTDMLNDSDYHPSTPQGILCFWDPTGSLGLTIEEAEEMDTAPPSTVTCAPQGSGFCVGTEEYPDAANGPG